MTTTTPTKKKQGSLRRQRRSTSSGDEGTGRGRTRWLGLRSVGQRASHQTIYCL